jgi:hypothetical protein
VGGTKGIGYVVTLALPLELPSIIIAIAGPGALLRVVVLSQVLTGVAQGPSNHHLGLCQSSELGTKRTDMGAAWLDDNPLTAYPFPTLDIYYAYPNLDDLALFVGWWVILPTGRFNINDNDLIELVSHTMSSYPGVYASSMYRWYRCTYAFTRTTSATKVQAVYECTSMWAGSTCDIDHTF